MHVAVTGGTGFVAGQVLTQAPRDWSVEGWSRTESAPEDLKADFRRVDLLNASQVAEALDSFTPDAVIHTAAIASIDYCMQYPDEADRVNTGIPRSLADPTSTVELPGDRGTGKLNIGLRQRERGNYPGGAWQTGICRW